MPNMSVSIYASEIVSIDNGLDVMEMYLLQWE